MNNNIWSEVNSLCQTIGKKRMYKVSKALIDNSYGLDIERDNFKQIELVLIDMYANLTKIADKIQIILFLQRFVLKENSLSSVNYQATVKKFEHLRQELEKLNIQKEAINKARVNEQKMIEAIDSLTVTEDISTLLQIKKILFNEYDSEEKTNEEINYIVSFFKECNFDKRLLFIDYLKLYMITDNHRISEDDKSLLYSFIDDILANIYDTETQKLITAANHNFDNNSRSEYLKNIYEIAKSTYLGYVKKDEEMNCLHNYTDWKEYQNLPNTYTRTCKKCNHEEVIEINKSKVLKKDQFN